VEGRGATAPDRSFYLHFGHRGEEHQRRVNHTAMRATKADRKEFQVANQHPWERALASSTVHEGDGRGKTGILGSAEKFGTERECVGSKRNKGDEGGGGSCGGDPMTSPGKWVEKKTVSKKYTGTMRKKKAKGAEMRPGLKGE